MNKRSFDDLMAVAKALYNTTRDMDREHSELEIVRVLATVYSEGGQYTLDEVQTRLALK